MIMYVIKNGTIHTGTGEVLENYDILIEGKRLRKSKRISAKQMQKLSMQPENKFSLVSSIHILLSELWGFRLVTEIMQKLQM
ncbi:hypothetical protein COPCOM_02119 [Coprococcus comes ATCC 27758]|uniref:Uncharacterized protein n=1 Tax=Coprococcus comes ATCC 27758 TaxID=470146 RepID=C0BAL6_9FIRM|nr:hypothetical protein COPCOM_02119 [Coprococcus comes ATCC 27758]